MEKVKEFMSNSCWGNEIGSYCIAAAVIAAGILILLAMDKIALVIIKKKAAKTKTSLDDFFAASVEKAIMPILYVLVVYFGINSLNLSAGISKYLDMAAIILVTVFGLRFLANFANYSVQNIWLRKEKDEKKAKNIKGALVILKVVIWGLGIVILLDNLGYKVSAVLAGLGIGGIAVALAAQAVLGDIFSYVSILFDRPFEIGDFIIVGDYLGTVENIGIKTTRIRSLGGEELIFSNSDLTGSRLKNYKRMYKRRIVFSLGVTYDTGLEKLKKIPEIIKQIINEVEGCAIDRSHFFSYADFSLVFETVYYVDVPDYNAYMDVQQEINLKIYEAFKKENIEFAFPTQTLHINKDV